MKILQRVRRRTSAPLDKGRDVEELRNISRVLMPNIYSDDAGIVRTGVSGKVVIIHKRSGKVVLIIF